MPLDFLLPQEGLEETPDNAAFASTLRNLIQVLGDPLAKLDPGLVERIDIPHDTLDKNFMLIKSKQHSEAMRIQPVKLNQTRRPVARIYILRLRRIRLPESEGSHLRRKIR